MRSVASLSLALTALLAALLAAPAPASAGKARHDRVERSIVRAVNHERAQHGHARLRSSRKLSRAANYHSGQMLARDFFAHGAFTERVRRFAPYRRIGETLAYMSSCRAGAIVRMWMNSSSHRAILLSGGYRRIGVGKRTGKLGSRRACVVTADFASRR